MWWNRIYITRKKTNKHCNVKNFQYRAFLPSSFVYQFKCQQNAERILIMQGAKLYCIEKDSRLCTDERLDTVDPWWETTTFTFCSIQKKKKKIADIIFPKNERAAFLGMQCHPLQLMVMNSCKKHGSNAAVLSVCVSEDYCNCVLLRFCQDSLWSPRREPSMITLASLWSVGVKAL